MQLCTTRIGTFTSATVLRLADTEALDFRQCAVHELSGIGIFSRLCRFNATTWQCSSGGLGANACRWETVLFERRGWHHSRARQKQHDRGGYARPWGQGAPSAHSRKAMIMLLSSLDNRHHRAKGPCASNTCASPSGCADIQTTSRRKQLRLSSSLPSQGSADGASTLATRRESVKRMTGCGLLRHLCASIPHGRTAAFPSAFAAAARLR